MAQIPLAFSAEIPVILVLRRTLTWNKHQQPPQVVTDWLPFPKKHMLPFQLKGGILEIRSTVAFPSFPQPPTILLLSLNLNNQELEIHGIQANQTFTSAPLSLSGKGGKMELHFQWSYFDVGDPERNQMKIGELDAGKSIEFRVNGKRDFSLTGRRDRSYLEQSYWIEHLGTARQLEQSKAPDFPIKLPEPDKLVDLRKLLW